MSVIRGIFTTWPGRIFAVALVSVIAAGGVLASRGGAEPEKQETRTQPVTRGSVVQSVAVTGSVAAQSQVKMSFKTQGRIAAIYVSVGQQVTVGQPLAKLDTTDLEAALARAHADLASAQNSYNRTAASIGDAQRNLEQTRQSTQNDIAAAEQNLARLKANYANQKANALAAGTTIYTDIGGYESALDKLKSALDIVVNDLAQAQRMPEVGLNAQNDVKSAHTAMSNSYAPLSSAQGLASSVLKPALDEYQRARDAIGAAILGFDAALAAGSDTNRSSVEFQQAMTSYNLAVSRLTNTIDTVNSALSPISGNIISAQASLNTTNTRSLTVLDRSRTDLAKLQTDLTNEQQLATTIKSRITQTGTALTTVSDAIGGSISTAMANVDSAIQRAAQSVQSAQTALAAKPFDLANAQSSVDNAAAAVATATSNLDNAVVLSPTSGVVASLASQVGENAASPFMVLANNTSLVLHGTVGEADVAKLKLGLVANVTVDAIGATARMTGKVTSLDPLATIQQGVPVYGIDVTIDVPNAQVKPGMTGTANVVIASKQGVLTVPNLAIRSTAGRRYVQVLKDGETVDAEVAFGIANDTMTEVMSGLAEGDLVVLPQSRATATTRPGGGGPGQPVFIGR